MFGTVPPRIDQGKNTRSPHARSIQGLDGERAFVGILTTTEQAFREHPFIPLDCHTP
jgi:hypothetical protein